VRNKEAVEAWVAETVEHFGRPLDGKSTIIDGR
jgi:hypothetical protein